MSRDPGRLRSMLFLAAAGLLAVLAGLFTHRMLAAHKAELARQAAPAKTIEVVQATSDIAAGVRPDPASLRLVPVREGLLPPGSYLESLDALVEAVPSSPIRAGEIVHPERFAQQPALYGVESALTPGMRAISLSLDVDAAVGGLVRPGRYVDAVVTVQAEANGVPTDWYTETVIQSARVLAVANGGGETQTVHSPTPDGAAGGGGAPAARTASGGQVVVTLELSPDESERLSLAVRRGDVRLALRRGDDLSPVAQDSPLVARALVGLPAAPAAEAEARVTKVRARMTQAAEVAAPETFSAEVVEGARREVQQVGPDGVQVGGDAKRRAPR